MMYQKRIRYKGVSLPLATASSSIYISTAGSSATPSASHQGEFFTVGEPIQALQIFPQGLPILVSGIKYDYENTYHPIMTKLKHEPENGYIYGKFQNTKEHDADCFDAVVLGRVERHD